MSYLNPVLVIVSLFFETMFTFRIFLFGLLISIGLGHIITSNILIRMKETVKERTKVKILPAHDYGVDSWKVGIIERTIFTLFVAFSPSAGAVGILTWIGLKILITWEWAKRKYEKAEDNPPSYLEALTGYRLVSFLGNSISMAGSFIGGSICWYAKKNITLKGAVVNIELRQIGLILVMIGTVFLAFSVKIRRPKFKAKGTIEKAYIEQVEEKDIIVLTETSIRPSIFWVGLGLIFLGTLWQW